jgi:hypothetical protein
MIEKIIIITLTVYGIFVTMQQGMIFEKLGTWIEDKLGDFWCKPVNCCPVCMSFWYGSILYWVVWHNNFLEWFICVTAAMGLSYIFVRLFPSD